MALLNSIGKRLGSPKGVAALAGVGLGVAASRSNLIEGDEDTYGMKQAIFEGVLGNPYADVDVIGSPLNPLRDILLPPLIPGDASRYRAMGHINRSLSWKNLQSDRRADKYRFNHTWEEDPNHFTYYEAGSRFSDVVSGAIENDGYDWNPMYGGARSQRRMTSNGGGDMGQIVFGAYNMRNGG